MADPDHQRCLEQHVAGWTSLQQAASHRELILVEHYAQHVDALADGEAGALEPNLVVEGAQVTVPAGSYWIPMAQPQKRWIQALLGEDPYTPFPYFYDVTSWSNPLLLNVEARWSGARLDDVAARSLQAPPAVAIVGADRDGGRQLWFAGDTAQSVAAALRLDRAWGGVHRLGADTVLPDGTALPAGAFFWDAPVDLAVAVEEVAAFPLSIHVTDAPVPPTAHRFEQPSIAVYRPPTAGVTLVSEAYGHLRWLLERDWGVPFAEVTAAEILAGALGDHDVLLVPAVATSDLRPAAGAIEAWISDGGVYVGTQRGSSGGTAFAVSNGFTTARQSALSGAQVGGTAFRVDVDADASPVALGAGDEAFWFNLGERVLQPSSTGANAVTYASGDDFWFSGYGTGVEPLAGTAGVVDEALGDGRVVLFSGEPSFRGYTEGMAFFLANALTYPVAAAPPTVDVAATGAASDVARARASTSALPADGSWRPLSVEVPGVQVPRALGVLRGLSTAVRVEATQRGTALLRIPNPDGLDVEAHPFTYRLRPALDAAGIEVISALL